MSERYTEELRSARLARGIDLKEVARATRISIRVLEAIEAGNMHVLPGAYTRAFLRDYANYLGLDPAHILAGFDAETPRVESVPASPTPRPTPVRISSGAPEQPVAEDEWRARAEPMKVKAPRVKRVDTNLTAVIATGIVVLTGFVLVYFFLSGDSGDKKNLPSTSQAPPPPIMPQYTPPQVEKKMTGDTVKFPNGTKWPVDSLSLEAVTTDSVWINIFADSLHVQHGTVQKGSHLMWRAKNQFIITLGNSRLVTFTMNGRRLTASDSGSRVLRNVLVTAATTQLSASASVAPPPPPAPIKQPVAAPLPVKTPVQAAKPQQQAPTKSVPPPAKQAVKQPAKQPVKAPAKTPTKQVAKPPAKKAPAKAPATPPAKPKEVKKKLKLKPWEDNTIKKVEIK